MSSSTRSFRTICYIISLAGISVILLSSCGRAKPGQENPSPAVIDKGDEMTFVGREHCTRCHEKETALYHDSDHDLAMDIADSGTVLGDFDDATFDHLGVLSRFYRKDGQYYVYTEGEEGEMKEFRIKYTFGYRPLQQYLVEFPDGRYQCLPLCWDTRPAEQGGQRWFHIYGDERIVPEDILFWTRTSQNWNFMCAECHSTDLKKGYDNQDKTYHTAWSEIDVSCESCHGPGSLHVKWAEEVEKGGPSDLFSDMGLAVLLKQREEATWIFDAGKAIARRSVPLGSDVLVETCARCHSRRSVMTEDYIYGQSLLQTHRPALLDENLYFPDGQIEDEVYVYASFLQSKMHQAGVTCTDCHEPHSTRIYVQGNALCYRCHLPDTYGVKSHHFHKKDSPGASCVECHMPERTYMVIDPRRDHSMRSPRPDLTLKIGTPNACNRCHSDKSAEWATDYFYKWYGPGPREKHYGETFWAARRAYPEALPELTSIAADRKRPSMVRATALSLMYSYPDSAATEALEKGMQDDDPLARYGAVEGSLVIEPEARNRALERLLNDSIRLIRTTAASNVMMSGTSKQGKETRKALDKALQEYLGIQEVNGDYPGSHLNLGNYYRMQGNMERAEDEYKLAISLEPAFVAGYINLADLYREMKREGDAETVLLQALGMNPDMPDAEYSLGLLYVRVKQPDQALVHLEKASRLAPGNARYAYAYALGLNTYGRTEEAIACLERSIDFNPYDRDLIYTLVTLYMERQEYEKAMHYATKLVEYYPDNAEFRQLFDYLQSQGGQSS